MILRPERFERGGEPAAPVVPRGSSPLSVDPTLLALASGSLVLYGCLFQLLRFRSLQFAKTFTLERWSWLRAFSDTLTPRGLAEAPPGTPLAAVNAVFYALVVTLLVVFWVIALRRVRQPAGGAPLGWLLAATVLFGIPLVCLPSMHSKDLYLFILYGREIALRHANPFLVPPSAFPDDPYVGWTPNSVIPSSYGPLWLLLSGGLSVLAGGGMLENLVVYKSALLASHVAATAILWSALRGTRREDAAWAAVFYGWNPLVLLETVGNGHSEGLMALCLAVALWAAARRAWVASALAVTGACLVKPTALLFLPPLVLVWLRSLPSWRSRVRDLAWGLTGSAICAAAIYAPLWAGGAWLDNARRNSAAFAYQNSVWHWLAGALSAGDAAATAWTQDILTPLRNAIFLLAFVAILHRVYRGLSLADSWAWVWFSYCLMLAWIWPWYLTLAIVAAAASVGRRSVALAGGLTLGGLLFWLGWPEGHAVAPWLREYKWLLLFGPALVMAIAPPRLWPGRAGHG